MNCRVCNVPAAPHEMTAHGEDKKGVCYPCALKLAEIRIDELERRLADVTKWQQEALATALMVMDKAAPGGGV